MKAFPTQQLVKVGQIAAQVGGATVLVVGGSPVALSAATVAVGLGAAAALVFVGHGIGKWFASRPGPG